MVNKVFIDTSGWISAIFKKDINHKTAVNYYLELEKCRNPVITSNYVISETLTWLNYNNNHNNALIYLDLLKKAEENNF
jgi:predicted nucleic acid-binding protein